MLKVSEKSAMRLSTRCDELLKTNNLVQGPATHGITGATSGGSEPPNIILYPFS